MDAQKGRCAQASIPSPEDCQFGTGKGVLCYGLNDDLALVDFVPGTAHGFSGAAAAAEAGH